MILVIMLLIALLPLSAVWWLVRGRGSTVNPEELSSLLQEVDSLAFKQLMSVTEIACLRQAVSPAAFRHLQRGRARVALGYLTRIARNASVLMTAAAMVREDDQNAAELEREALQVRMLALRARFAVALWFIFPNAHVDLPLAGRYDRLRGHYEQLLRGSRESAHSSA